VGSYDPYTTTGRASAEGWWSFVNARPWNMGGFVWTGFDYRGEPSPNEWPNISSQYGVIDVCGFPKDTFFYYQSWWTAKPVLHMFPHWNWPDYEGKEIAVWVHSNMDRVELFLNGQSLGAKDMKKDSHLAWNVKYVSGTLEARGFKDGKLAMTAKRETTGAPAKLVMAADRTEFSANGEDVVMCAVEVRDAHDRVVPITDNDVTFQITGPAKLIGVGNGDPTDHGSDKGSSRKAFGGLCMAIIQAEKKGGSITVEASAPGLTASSVTISAKESTLRPQVDSWKREVPEGSGITGLWRPAPGSSGATGLMAMLVGDGTTVFTLRQDGGKLTGSVEGAGGGFFGGNDTPATIEDGKIEGGNVTFKAGNNTFAGTIKGDQIELERSMNLGFRMTAPKEATGPQPAIGPPPDGSDPSFNASIRRLPKIEITLRRVER
jgi:beta-galactosidase